MRLPSAIRLLLRNSGLVVLTLALGACSAPYPFGNPQAKSRVVGELGEPVVLEALADMTVVPVTINGRGGFRFLLDTGATPTALFMTDKTRALGLVGSGDFRPGGAGAGSAPVSTVARGVNLRIGAVALNDMAVALLPASAIPVLGDEKSFLIDGIIGYDVFKRFAVQVDYAGQRLRLFRAGDAPVAPGDAVLPLELKGSDAYVTVPLAQRPGDVPTAAHLHVDSGHTGNLSLIIGSDPGITQPDLGWVSTAYGIQGATQGMQATVARLRLGDVELKDLRAGFETSMDTYAGRQGRLGHGVLERFVYTVDLQGKRLILRPSGQTLRPELQGVTGLGVLPYDDGFVVRRVQPGTPAQAQGFKPGERIVSLAGEPLAGKDGRQVARMLELEPGQSIEICIAAGRTLCRTLVAADYRHPPMPAP